MDTTDPTISFNEKGHCNHCSHYIEKLKNQTYQGTETDTVFESIVKTIKKAGKHQKYDCLIGLSGGVDSCYSAYIAKQKGLNPLLVHLDNGWDSPISVSNCKKLASDLGFDFENHTLDSEEFTQLQIAFLKSSIVDAEYPTDVALPAVLNEVAAKHNIRYIISGGNYTSEGILPKIWGYHVMKDMKLYNHIINKFSSVPRKKIPSFGIVREMYFKFIKGHRNIYLLNYVPYDKDKAQHFLEQKFGLQFDKRKHNESVYTGFLQSYILPTKFNIDYRKATFSSQICSGQITRDEAITRLQEPFFDAQQVERDKLAIAFKFGLNITELEEIMAKEPKTYRDFPNNDKWLTFVYKTYQVLFPGKRV